MFKGIFGSDKKKKEKEEEQHTVKFSEPIARDATGITFDVVRGLTAQSPPSAIDGDLRSFIEKSKFVKSRKGCGVLLTSSSDDGDTTRVSHSYGSHASFVGAAITAYSKHLHLILKPDDVWLQITISLARYIDAHAEELRPIFVNHSGQIELTAHGGGNIFTANYDDLVDQITRQLDEHTKEDVAPWMTCNFSTTTKKEQFVSKLVLMGAMKAYFSYKMCLECGLPKVTLEGTVEDWKEIRNRVEKMKDWSEDLSQWAEVLGFVLDEFVKAAEGLPNTAFWNRIATIKGGGSGPRWLHGWILAFIAFDAEGKYFLPHPVGIKNTNDYGKLDTNDIPHSTVDVPVTVDDNGREYKTIFWAGFHLSRFNKEQETLRPSVDWALLDVTACK